MLPSTKLTSKQKETNDRPALDATLTTEHEADAQHFALHAQHATAGTTGQHVTIQEHPLVADQTQKTPTMKMLKACTSD